MKRPRFGEDSAFEHKGIVSPLSPSLSPRSQSSPDAYGATRTLLHREQGIALITEGERRVEQGYGLNPLCT